MADRHTNLCVGAWPGVGAVGHALEDLPDVGAVELGCELLDPAARSQEQEGIVQRLFAERVALLGRCNLLLRNLHAGESTLYDTARGNGK